MIDGSDFDPNSYEDDDVQVGDTNTHMQFDGESGANYPEYLSILPAELWFKIYEDILTDLDWQNKHHFAMSCRFFKSIFDDEKFIQSFVTRLPYLRDAHEADKVSACAYRAGPLARFFKAPDNTQYINWYLRNGLLFGYDFDEVISKLRSKLDEDEQKVLEPIIERKAKWVKAVQYAHLADYSGINMDEMPLGEFLTCAAMAGNLRALIAVFNPLHFEQASITGIRWAYICNKDYMLLLRQRREKLLAEKELIDANNLQADDLQREIALIESIIANSESDNWEEFQNQLRQYLDVNIDCANIQNALRSPYFNRQLQTWGYDAIFAAMSLETFETLFQSSGQSPYLILPLIRTRRYDLLQALQIELGLRTDGIAENLIAEEYMRLLSQLHAMNIDSDESDTIQAMINILNQKPCLVSFIASSASLFKSALSEGNVDVTKRCLVYVSTTTPAHWEITVEQRAFLFETIRKNNCILRSFLSHTQFFPEGMLYGFFASDERGEFLWDELRKLEDTRENRSLLRSLSKECLTNGDFPRLAKTIKIACNYAYTFRVRLAALLLEELDHTNEVECNCIISNACALLDFQDPHRKAKVDPDSFLTMLSFAPVEYLISFCERHLTDLDLDENLEIFMQEVQRRNNHMLTQAFIQTVMNHNMASALPQEQQLTWLSMIPFKVAKEMINRNGRKLTESVLAEKFGSNHELTKYAKEKQKWLQSDRFYWFNNDFDEKPKPQPKKRK